MSKNTLMAIMIVLTLLVVADAGIALYRATQGQPPNSWGIFLLVPWIFGANKLIAMLKEEQTSTGEKP